MAIFNININQKAAINIAGEVINKDNLVYLGADGLWYNTSAAYKNSSTTEIKLSLSTTNIGGVLELMDYGYYVFPNSPLVANSKYYVSVDYGKITTIQYDNSSNIIRYIGTAKDSSTLLFNPDQTYISDYNSKINDITIKASSIFNEHTHLEEDISDLNKYTQEEVTEFINTREPSLGNPSTNGYVLSSTTAGVRSWISIGGGTPTLQQVTTAGNTSTNTITVSNGLGSSVNIYPSGVLNLIAPGTSYFMAMEASTGQFGAYNGTNFKTLLQFPVASAAHTINIPNKSGTFALLDDITSGGGIALTDLSAVSPLAYDPGTGTFVHWDTDGTRHIPANGTTNAGKVLTASSSAGLYTWETPASGSGSGTVTSVTAGTGMTQTGTATINPTLNVIGGNGIVANTDNIALTTLSAAWNAGSTYSITAADFIGSSDKRLKENIELLPSIKINSIYRSFNFKTNTQQRIGVIAQELEIEHPEFVRTDEDGMKSVSYNDLHSAEIAYLKDKVEQLEIMLILLLKQ